MKKKSTNPVQSKNLTNLSKKKGIPEYSTFY
jgi:hypothetical protein